MRKAPIAEDNEGTKEQMQLEIESANIEEIPGRDFDISRVDLDKYRHIESSIESLVAWLKLPSVYDQFGITAEAHDVRRKWQARLSNEYGNLANDFLDKIKTSNKIRGNNRAVIREILFYLKGELADYSDLIESIMKDLGELSNASSKAFMNTFENTEQGENALKERMKRNIKQIEDKIIDLLNKLTAGTPNIY